MRMTRQEAFDKALNGIMTQGKAATDGNRGVIACRYREDTTAECPVRCAAGHLIPDELYSPGMEGNTIQHIVLTNPKIGALLPTSYATADSLLTALQHAHDHAAIDEDNCGTPFMPAYLAKMRAIAQDYDLEMGA